MYIEAGVEHDAPAPLAGELLEALQVGEWYAAPEVLLRCALRLVGNLVGAQQARSVEQQAWAEASK